MKKVILITALALFSLHVQLEACGSKNKITEVQLTRTPCFGTCPWYTLVLSADGNMRYEGKKFVKNEGDYRGNISKNHSDEIKEIFEFINGLKVDTFQERYDAGVTDLPGLKMLFVNKKGKPVKEIMMVGVEPESLKVLAKKLDALVPEDQIPTELPVYKPLEKN